MKPYKSSRMKLFHYRIRKKIDSLEKTLERLWGEIDNTYMLKKDLRHCELETANLYGCISGLYYALNLYEKIHGED